MPRHTRPVRRTFQNDAAIALFHSGVELPNNTTPPETSEQRLSRYRQELLTAVLRNPRALPRDMCDLAVKIIALQA